MKKLALIAVPMLMAAGAFAQGTVNFNNNITGSLRATVYGVNVNSPTTARNGNSSAGIPAGAVDYTGSALLVGTGFTAQLWGAAGTGASEGSLAVVATTSFRTGSAAGFVNTALLPGGQSAVAIPGAPTPGPAAQATIQLRAWDNLGGVVGSWSAAMAAGAPSGKSTLFNTGTLGGTDSPAASPPNLTGLTSFNLTIVPEPGVIALGVLGLGALLLRRRK